MAEVPAARETTTVIVRAYPKIVYLYLTWLASIVCGIIQPPIVEGALTPEHISKSALVGRVSQAIAGELSLEDTYKRIDEDIAAKVKQAK